MKIFAIIKNNNFAKVLFFIVALLVIFHQVIYYLINEKLFKNEDNTEDKNENENENKNENENENKEITESFINLENNKSDNSIYKDKEFINNLKDKHEKQLDKYKLNTYPNLDSKKCNLFFSENKFLPECCVLNYEFSSSNGCPCITPQQKYYLQYRGNNKNKE